MSQTLDFHRIQKITLAPVRTLTTEDGTVFSTTKLTIHSLDPLDRPMQTEIGLFADQPEALSIEPEEMRNE
jgi:hypothetical protein